MVPEILLPPPEEWPQPGFYHHYKHDPAKDVRNYAYYIYGIGHHTEGDDCRPEDLYQMVYRPLYPEAFVYRRGKLFDLRPLHIFYEPAEVHGQAVPRFRRIERPEQIAELSRIMHEMYGTL